MNLGITTPTGRMVVIGTSLRDCLKRLHLRPMASLAEFKTWADHFGWTVVELADEGLKAFADAPEDEPIFAVSATTEGDIMAKIFRVADPSHYPVALHTLINSIAEATNKTAQDVLDETQKIIDEGMPFEGHRPS